MPGSSPMQVIITYAEWQAWLSAGRLRLAGHRIGRLAGQIDRDGFARLLDHAPDVSIQDDEAFLITHLLSDAIHLSTPLSPVAALYPLKCVVAFEALSERGFRLLEADAHRAGVNLAAPRHEALWSHWRDEQHETRASAKASHVGRALGLGEPMPLQERLLDLLLGRLPVPNPERRVDYRATRAEAWAEAFAIARLLDETALPRDMAAIKSLLEHLKAEHDLGKPVLDLAAQADDLRGLLSDLHQPSETTGASLSQLALIRHYAGLWGRERRVDVRSLAEDLVELGVSCGKQAASQAAAILGRCMPDALATSILIAVEPDAHPAFAPMGQPHSWGIGEAIDLALSAGHPPRPDAASAAVAGAQVAGGPEPHDEEPVSQLEALAQPAVAGDAETPDVAAVEEPRVQEAHVQLGLPLEAAAPSMSGPPTGSLLPAESEAPLPEEPLAAAVLTTPEPDSRHGSAPSEPIEAAHAMETSEPVAEPLSPKPEVKSRRRRVSSAEQVDRTEALDAP